MRRGVDKPRVLKTVRIVTKGEDGMEGDGDEEVEGEDDRSREAVGLSGSLVVDDGVGHEDVSLREGEGRREKGGGGRQAG